MYCTWVLKKCLHVLFSHFQSHSYIKVVAIGSTPMNIPQKYNYNYSLNYN